MTDRGRPRLGSPEWQRRFERDQARFNRAWPWWAAFCAVAAVVVLVLVATGRLPVWLLFL